MESATYAQLRGEEMRWSVTDHLLAGVIDKLAVLTYVQVASKAKKGAKVPKPVPVPRPSDANGPVVDDDVRIAGVAYLQAKRDEHAAAAKSSKPEGA